MTSAEESDGKGGTTAASRCRVWITDNKLRTLQVFFVINLSAHQILNTHRINHQRDALILNLTVAVLDFFVERESVLET